MLRAFFQRAPELKSTREIGLMREAGKLVARALRLCREMAKPGVRTIEIDQAVAALFAQHRAVPLFKGYPGRIPFPAAPVHRPAGPAACWRQCSKAVNVMDCNETTSSGR